MTSNLITQRERESRNDNGRLSQDKTDRHNAERVGYVDKGTGEHQSNQVYDENGLSRTMQHTDYKDPMLVRTGGFIQKGTGEHQSNKVYSKHGNARTLDANDYKHPIQIIEND